MNFKIVLADDFGEDIINQIYLIHSQKLGSGYLKKREIKQSIRNKRIIVALNNNEVVGYLKFDICTENDFFRKENINIIGSNLRVLVLNICAVKYEKVGIGTALTNFILDNNLTNVEKIFCPIWTSRLGTNAIKIMERFNFTKVKSCPKHWYKDSIGKKNFCPVCDNPCTCCLDIYVKDVR